MFKVFVDGQEGTTGLRIAERLSSRSDIQLLTIRHDLLKDREERSRLMNQADVVFLCLPDAAAVEAASMAADHVKVIDASTAHRTLKDWVYGFPELSSLQRSNVVKAARVSVPGCHASGFVALVFPLRAMGLLSEDDPLVCFSVTGYSGGGKSMIAQYQSDSRDAELDSPRQYATSQNHKHLREMTKVCGLSEPPIFCPIVADYYSGMVVTVPLHTDRLRKKCSIDQIRRIFMEHYKDQALIEVLPDSVEGFLGANNLAGRDSMEISVSGNEERVLLTARFDNLGKGASGAAVQCMNLMLGLDETTGLVR